jgi:hypothetical protein
MKIALFTSKIISRLPSGDQTGGNAPFSLYAETLFQSAGKAKTDFSFSRSTEAVYK